MSGQPSLRISHEQRNAAEESASSYTATTISNETAATVTTTFVEKYRATFESMDDNDKWVLPSGAIVENVMFSYGATCDHENPCHSFILDVDDPVWLTLFPDELDREVLFNHERKPIPEIKPELKEYLSSYIGKSDFRSLMDHARSRFFDRMDDFDMDWAQHSMETALRLFSFGGKNIGLEDSTESDILMRLWIFIDKAFDDVPVDILSGVMESLASSDRKNKGRKLEKRKVYGGRADLVLKCTIG